MKKQKTLSKSVKPKLEKLPLTILEEDSFLDTDKFTLGGLNDDQTRGMDDCAKYKLTARFGFRALTDNIYDFDHAFRDILEGMFPGELHFSSPVSVGGFSGTSRASIIEYLEDASVAVDHLARYDMIRRARSHSLRAIGCDEKYEGHLDLQFDVSDATMLFPALFPRVEDSHYAIKIVYHSFNDIIGAGLNGPAIERLKNGLGNFLLEYTDMTAFENNQKAVRDEYYGHQTLVRTSGDITYTKGHGFRKDVDDFAQEGESLDMGSLSIRIERPKGGKVDVVCLSSDTSNALDHNDFAHSDYKKRADGVEALLDRYESVLSNRNSLVSGSAYRLFDEMCKLKVNPHA